MKLHRTYPIWLHLLHIVYHGVMSTSQLVGFVSSFHPPGVDLFIPEHIGPGWRFRYVTTWILATLALFMFAAFLFDIVLILRGINDLTVRQLKKHLDRFFCLMFSTCVGMGFFFHLLFFINCTKNGHCPNYSDSLWFIHLMPFWYGLAEYFCVPHNTKRDIKTTSGFVLIFCLIYFINYWLFVAQTHGQHPYGDPWPVWQWLAYFCIPLTMIALRMLGFVRDRLFYKRRLRSHCIYPPTEFHQNPWIGWHVDYCQVDEIGIQPVDWKMLGVMTATLLIVVTIWNITYAATTWPVWM